MGYYSTFHLTYKEAPEWITPDHIIDVVLHMAIIRNHVTGRQINDDLVVKQFNEYLNLNTGSSSDYVLESEIFKSGKANRHDLIRLANYILEHFGYTDSEKRYSVILRDIIQYGSSDKWYDYKEDMIEVSKRYPMITFILDRKGEEAGDLEKSYYKNGKCEVIKAEITYREPTLI